MTILNCWVTPSEALVGVDTETVLPDGNRARCSKLIPIVHINAVMAIRGHVLMLTVLFNMLHWANLKNFDELLDGMAEMLPLAFDQVIGVAEKVLGMKDSSTLDNQTVVVVGWSDRNQRVVGWEYEQTSRSEGFVSGIIRPHHISPWDPTLSALPDPTTIPAMEKLAQAQVELMRQQAPGAAAGGRLITAELTERGILIAPRCRLN